MAYNLVTFHGLLIVLYTTQPALPRRTDFIQSRPSFKLTLKGRRLPSF